MRPAAVWAAFAVTVAAILAAMGWNTATVLRLERAEAAARAQATLEENVRLALWRMDSFVAPLLAQEAARPYFEYSAFYPREGAFARMFAEAAPDAPLLASPLSKSPAAPILLHFQLDPRGRLTSPQVPDARWSARVQAEGPARRREIAGSAERLRRLGGLVTTARFDRTLPAPAPNMQAPARIARKAPPPAPVASQKLKSALEYEARVQNVQTQMLLQDRAAEAGLDVASGPITPLWIDDALVLARRVRVSGEAYVQGCWLDWPRLQQDLAASVADLFPAARLMPLGAAAPDDGERRLATLPVRFEPGGSPSATVDRLSPPRLSLLAAWVCVLLAAGAVGALLAGVLSLSERRRVFVSAVTHELRTPLTTFRLYSDMLADGMVPGDEKRQEYLERLQSEARRLGHLVDNVLFYARLESGRAQAVRERVVLGAFVEEAAVRLAERAERAGMSLSCHVQPDARDCVAQVDRSALEQILVNLVDNACKYGSASSTPSIEVRLERGEGRAVLRVRDHGPGLSARDRRRLFRPFSRSDREAAGNAPGVGLGLALSRRLARAQGGDLQVDEHVHGGAGFTITLPLAPQP
jgi:signal transduction histidine kinase